MSLSRLLENKALEPAQIQAMAYAFESVCRDLGLSLRDEARRENVARKVIEFWQRGERDRDRLRAVVLIAPVGAFESAVSRLRDDVASTPGVRMIP